MALRPVSRTRPTLTGGVSDLNNDFGYRAGSPRTLSGGSGTMPTATATWHGQRTGLRNVTIELYIRDHQRQLADRSRRAAFGTPRTASRRQL